MTVDQLIQELTELNKGGHIVDARYMNNHDLEIPPLPDCYVDDLSVMDLPHSTEGYVTLILGDPS